MKRKHGWMLVWLVLLALVLPVRGQIVDSPPLTLLDRALVLPELGEDGMPNGIYTTQQWVVAWYDVTNHVPLVQWHYRWRTKEAPATESWQGGTGVASNQRDRITGKLRRMLILPYRADYTNAYLFLPVVQFGQEGT